MTLTVALAVVAGIVLAGVVGQGAWSARKASPRRADPQGPGGAPESRVDPSMEDHASAGGGGSVVLDPGASARTPAGMPRDIHGNLHADIHADPPLAELRRSVHRRSPRLDALIDAIVPLTLESPITGELALIHLPPSRRAGTKPFLIEGLNAANGEWELPVAGQRYGEFQAGVQLANRHGALNQIEYSEFVQKVEAFADHIGAMADLPDMIEAVSRARELDAFANPHDAHLTVLLRANSAAWSVGYVQQCALRQGFVPGVLPGRLVLPSQEEGAPPVLIIGFDAQAALADDPNQSAVREISLSLDVPQTDEAAEPFAAWQETARALAADMDAALVDDSGRPITLHAYTSIGEELKKLYAALAERDLAAGSPAARRLFS